MHSHGAVAFEGLFVEVPWTWDPFSVCQEVFSLYVVWPGSPPTVVLESLPLGLDNVETQIVDMDPMDLQNTDSMKALLKREDEIAKDCFCFCFCFGGWRADPGTN